MFPLKVFTPNNLDLCSVSRAVNPEERIDVHMKPKIFWGKKHVFADLFYQTNWRLIVTLTLDGIVSFSTVNEYLTALQIFIVILLCKSIKVMGVIYSLMIENFFCKFYNWNLGMAKYLSKSLKNKNQCWSELLWVYSRF